MQGEHRCGANAILQVCTLSDPSSEMCVHRVWSGQPIAIGLAYLFVSLCHHSDPFVLIELEGEEGIHGALIIYPRLAPEYHSLAAR